MRIVAAAALTLGLLLSAPAGAEGPGADSSAAVALMYHRFGEDRIPTTNIRIEQFESHLRILATEGYRVVPLDEIVDALEKGAPVPEKTVAITVDDAYASVATVAWPRIRAKGWTLTLFVATDPVDAGTPGYLSWEKMRALKAEGMRFGLHSKSHPHMAKLSTDAIAAEIRDSAARFAAELGEAPRLFAYPYGEADLRVMAAVKAAGFRFAFGQHSGVISAAEAPLFLPRFALNEHYGDESRFRLVTAALPLPATEISPADPTLSRNPPNFGFTVPPEVGPIANLRCYASSPGETKTEILGRRVEVRQAQAFTGVRGRLNCTLPGPKGRWRWLGRMFFIPDALRPDHARDD